MDIDISVEHLVSELVNDFITNNCPSSEIDELFDNLTIVSDGNDELVASIISTRIYLEEVRDNPLYLLALEDYQNSSSCSRTIESPVSIQKPEVFFTLFIKMIFWNKVSLVEAFLDRYPTIDIEYRFRYRVENECAFFLAASLDHKRIAYRLLAHGANVNHVTSTGSTSLRLACFDNNVSLIQFLLANGADPNIPNNYGNTPLMAAAFVGNKEICEILLESGARADAQTNRCKSTALHYAIQCETNDMNIIKSVIWSILRDSSFPRSLILIEDHTGTTPFMQVVKGNFEDPTKDLLAFLLAIPNLTTVTEKIDALEYTFAQQIFELDSTLAMTSMIVDDWIRPAFYLRWIGLNFGQKPFDIRALNKFLKLECPDFEGDKLPSLVSDSTEFKRFDDFYRIRLNRYLLTKAALEIFERILGSSPICLSTALLKLGRKLNRGLNSNMLSFIQNCLIRAISIRIDHRIFCGNCIKGLGSLVLFRCSQEPEDRLKLISEVLDVIIDYYHARPRPYGNALLRLWHNSGCQHKFLEFSNVTDVNEDSLEPTQISVQDSNNVFVALVALLDSAIKKSKEGLRPAEIFSFISIQSKFVYINRLRVSEYYTGKSLLHAVLSEGHPDSRILVSMPEIRLTWCFLLETGSDLNSFDILYNTPVHYVTLFGKVIDLISSMTSEALLNEKNALNDFPNSQLSHPNQDSNSSLLPLNSRLPRYYGGCKSFHFDQQNILGHDFLRAHHLIQKASTSTQDPTVLNSARCQMQKIYNESLTLKCLAAREVNKLYFQCENCRGRRIDNPGESDSLIQTWGSEYLAVINQGRNNRFVNLFRSLLRTELKEYLDEGISTLSLPKFVYLTHQPTRLDPKHVCDVMQYFSDKYKMSIELIQFIEMHGPCKFIYHTVPTKVSQL